MASTIEPAGDIETIIARNALKYDLFPYESRPYPASQPGRLAAICKLFALDVAPIETARVLELGCAAGGNIIPHAVRYPDARYVGVDLARTQVAAGRTRIRQLELSNIEILCRSFTEIGDEIGSFDYIICHGVFSWVPPAVQDAIFRVIRSRLSPVGVACISYNVLPGWRMMQPLRDAFLLQIPDSVDSLGRVAKARNLLEFMKNATPDKGPYGDMLRVWAERLSGLPDDYIAHEFLEETNAPCTLRDFTHAAARHGLGYLGECDFAAMILDHYGASVAEAVRARSGNDLIETEQYLDLLSGRVFRQSLLVAAERMARVDRTLTPDRVADLQFLAPAGMAVVRDGEAGRVTDSNGRSLTSTDKAVIDAMARFVARFPASSGLDDLAAGMDRSGRDAVREALYKMAVAGMVQISTAAVTAGPDVGEMPVALKLARMDAAAGAGLTTNQRHESVALDAAAKILVPAMDGSRDHAALQALLRTEARAGRLVYNRGGQPIDEPGALEAAVAEHLPLLLTRLAAAGLVE